MKRTDTTKSENEKANCLRKFALTVIKLFRLCKRKEKQKVKQ